MIPEDLPIRQIYFIVISGFFLLILILELVRRRKLLEQYSAMWLAIGIFSIAFVWIYPIIQEVTQIIGAGQTTSTILFFAFFSLLILNLQLCVKISEFSYNIKDIAQDNALLRKELEDLRKQNKVNPSENSVRSKDD